MKNVLSLLFICCSIVFAFGQETTNELKASSLSFTLPTFEELSNTITKDIITLEKSLPDLSNIGKYIQRTQDNEEGNLSLVFRNFGNDLSLVPNIFSTRYRLRNDLNSIMFNGYDINQLINARRRQ